VFLISTKTTPVLFISLARDFECHHCFVRYSSTALITTCQQAPQTASERSFAPELSDAELESLGDVTHHSHPQTKQETPSAGGHSCEALQLLSLGSLGSTDQRWPWIHTFRVSCPALDALHLRGLSFDARMRGTPSGTSSAGRPSRSRSTTVYRRGRQQTSSGQRTARSL
jgi:hypothetical protein